MAQVDAFLKIKDIPGESEDSKHKGEIEVLSWSWGLTQSGTAHFGGGAGGGKVNVGDLHFIKRTDAGSHALHARCADGAHVPEAVLTMRKAGGKAPVEYLKITMNDLIVTSVQTAGNGEGGLIPTESVTLNFAKFKYEYTGQDSKGSPLAVKSAGWDIRANKAI